MGTCECGLFHGRWRAIAASVRRRRPANRWSWPLPAGRWGALGSSVRSSWHVSFWRIAGSSDLFPWLPVHPLTPSFLFSKTNSLQQQMAIFHWNDLLPSTVINSNLASLTLSNSTGTDEWRAPEQSMINVLYLERSVTQLTEIVKQHLSLSVLFLLLLLLLLLLLSGL